jgi:hypothetical protein
MGMGINNKPWAEKGLKLLVVKQSNITDISYIN